MKSEYVQKLETYFGTIQPQMPVIVHKLDAQTYYHRSMKSGKFVQADFAGLEARMETMPDGTLVYRDMTNGQFVTREFAKKIVAYETSPKGEGNIDAVCDIPGTPFTTVIIEDKKRASRDYSVRGKGYRPNNHFKADMKNTVDTIKAEKVKLAKPKREK